MSSWAEGSTSSARYCLESIVYRMARQPSADFGGLRSKDLESCRARSEKSKARRSTFPDDFRFSPTLGAGDAGFPGLGATTSRSSSPCRAMKHVDLVTQRQIFELEVKA